MELYQYIGISTSPAHLSADPEQWVMAPPMW